MSLENVASHFGHYSAQGIRRKPHSLNVMKCMGRPQPGINCACFKRQPATRLESSRPSASIFLPALDQLRQRQASAVHPRIRPPDKARSVRSSRTRRRMQTRPGGRPLYSSRALYRTMSAAACGANVAGKEVSMKQY